MGRLSREYNSILRNAAWSSDRQFQLFLASLDPERRMALRDRANPEGHTLNHFATFERLEREGRCRLVREERVENGRRRKTGEPDWKVVRTYVVTEAEVRRRGPRLPSENA